MGGEGGENKNFRKKKFVQKSEKNTKMSIPGTVHCSTYKAAWTALPIP